MGPADIAALDPAEKYQPTELEIARAAARREAAKRQTTARIKSATVTDLAEATIICLQCGNACEIRSRERITARLKRRPFYYSRWGYCKNPNCKCTGVYRNEDRVFRDDADADIETRNAEIRQQLRPRR